MFTKTAAERATDWLVQGGGIKAEERVVYEFGLDKLFSILVNFFFAMMLGQLFGVFWQAIVFYITYAALRVYAGGYHAEKPITCFFASVGILIPCFMVIRLYQTWDTPFLFWGVLSLSVITLLLLGPVEHKSKMLSAVEKRVYRKRMVRNLIIILIIVIVLSISSLDSFGVAILCGITLTAITAIAGKARLIKQIKSNV